MKTGLGKAADVCGGGVITSLARPVMRYHGGKWRLATWIIGYFPEHRVYVEPFGGGASVLLRKPRSYSEVYNDLSGDVVNVFRVLRDREQAAELERALRLTPFAMAEFELAYRRCEYPVERARRTLVRAHMGFGSYSTHRPSAIESEKPGTGFRHGSTRSGSTPAHDWMNYPDCIRGFTERLQGVVIEQRDAKMVMAAHDTPATLHYLDPPYVHSTRCSGDDTRKRNQYQFEMSDEDHAELAALVRTLSGAVVISGYDCPLYQDLFAGWYRVQRETFADGARPRTEVLWLNDAAKLGARQSRLFDVDFTSTVTGREAGFSPHRILTHMDTKNV